MCSVLWIWLKKTHFTINTESIDSGYICWATPSSLAGNRKYEDRISLCVMSVLCHSGGVLSLSYEPDVTCWFCSLSTCPPKFHHAPLSFPVHSGCSEVLFANHQRKDALKLGRETIPCLLPVCQVAVNNCCLDFFHRHEAFCLVYPPPSCVWLSCKMLTWSLNISFFHLWYKPQFKAGLRKEVCFYQAGPYHLLSYGTSWIFARDHNLIWYISQSTTTVLLRLALLDFSQLSFSGRLFVAPLPDTSCSLRCSYRVWGHVPVPVLMTFPNVWSLAVFSYWSWRAAQGNARLIPDKGKSGKEIFHHL